MSGERRGWSRRDFLQGVAVATAVGPSLLRSRPAVAGATPYPPGLTGLRGSHPGSFEWAHALARGGQSSWGPVSWPDDEVYDLVGPHGLDIERDVAGITVNRWPHGYACSFDSLDDEPFEAGQAPYEVGRARFGRIAIANSDAAGRAYADAAVDMGYRAVGEVLAG